MDNRNQDICVLIADNSLINLAIAEKIISEKYNTITARSGEECLQIMKQNAVNMLLLDACLPDMSTVEVIHKMREILECKQVPVIMLTPEYEYGLAVDGLKEGALDFLTKPFFMDIMIQRIDRVLELNRLQTRLNEEVKLQTAVAEERRIKVETMAMQTIHTLATTIDAKDTYTNGHSTRVADYSAALAREMGWDDEAIQRLHSAAVLHDIGKIGVPDRVLNKPGKLTDDEYAIIKSHTSIGSEILKKSNVLEDAETVARHHHERFDGRGYPDRLAGEDIPLAARIVGVADSYDAMNSRRVYRRPLPKEVIRGELVRGRGFQFDPECCDAFLRLFDNGTLDEMNKKYESPSDKNNKTDSDFAIDNGGDRDHLTELVLRAEGEKRINEELEKGKGYFFLLDIDNLKKINEAFGYVAGDRLLVELGTSVKSVLRPLAEKRLELLLERRTEDDMQIPDAETRGTIVNSMNMDGLLACRLGGDELVVCLMDIKEEEAGELAESFIHSFEQAARKLEGGLMASLSIGITATVQDDNFELAYQRADKALYHVKQMDGSYHYFYHTRMDVAFRPSNVDLQQLVQSLMRDGSYDGAIDVRYHDFVKMFEYVGNLRKRYKHNFYLIMITLENALGETRFIEEIESAVASMEYAIHQNIRNVDVCTRYSSVQFLVILMEASEDSVKTVMDRIFADFYKRCGENPMQPTYSIAMLGDEEE